MNHTKKKIVKLFLVEDPKNTYEDISGYYDLFYNYNGCREPTLIYLLISKDGCWKICTHYDYNPYCFGNKHDSKQFLADRLLEIFESYIMDGKIKLK